MPSRGGASTWAAVRALRQLGYRQMRLGVWGKPVGYSLFAVRELHEGTALRWEHWFRGVGGKLLLYDRHELLLVDEARHGGVSSWLKYVENYTRNAFDHEACGGSSFEFDDAEGAYAALLEEEK